MANSNSNFYLDNVSIPILEGIPAKCKSLGQFQGAFERHIEVILTDTRLADLSGSGGDDSHCNQCMLDLLDRDFHTLEIAFKNGTLDQRRFRRGYK